MVSQNNDVPPEDIEYKARLRASNEVWLSNRIGIASKILNMSDFKTIDTRFDAQIILCCALCSVAATVWPGSGGDRNRSIEIMASYGSVVPSLKTISIPILLKKLDGRTEQRILREKFWKYPKYQVVKASEVDCEEEQLLRLIPTLSRQEVRACSYASIIYSDLRCALVHTFSLGENVIDWTFGDDSDLKYIHRGGSPVLFIPYKYLEDSVRSTGFAIFRSWELRNDFERTQPLPAKWWIKGG